MTQTIFDGLPLPPVAGLLGWRLVALDLQAGMIEAEFLASSEFTKPTGFSQGDMIAAMLDDTHGSAAFAMSCGRQISTTIDLHLVYVRPVWPGRVATTAKVISLGSRIAFADYRPG